MIRKNIQLVKIVLGNIFQLKIEINEANDIHLETAEICVVKKESKCLAFSYNETTTRFKRSVHAVFCSANLSSCETIS